MKNNFICPNCQSKQKLKHLIFLSNNSTWHCHKCNSSLKPQRKPLAGVLIGLFAGLFGAMPTYYSMFILNFKLITSLSIGILMGVFTYFIVLWYYHYSVIFEKVD